MDFNGGRATPLLGADLIAAIEAAVIAHSDARFEGNSLGNLAVTDRSGAYVGSIDVRSPTVDDPADRWQPMPHDAIGPNPR